MKVFDGRHKWGAAVHAGARITRTCQVCGRTDSYETIVPDGFVAKMIEFAQKPNPYRQLVKSR